MSKPVEVGGLRVGSYVIINEVPCRIVDYSKSKPGKHGSAKARIVAMGVFDGVKRSFVKPVNAQVEVPIIEKREGQVLSLLQRAIQMMDLETYQIFEIPLTDEETTSKLVSGAEVEYWRILDKVKIMRVKG